MLGTADHKPQPLARTIEAPAAIAPWQAPALPAAPPAPNHLTFVTSQAALSALEPEWRDLEARAGTRFNYFQTFDWISNWWRHVAPSMDAGLLILTARRDGRLTLIWPLMIVPEKGLRVIKWLSEPHLQYGDVLAEAGPGLPALLDEAWSLIKAHDGHDAIALGKVLSTAHVYALLERRCPVACNPSVASQLDLSAFDTCAAFGKAIGRSRRKRHTQRYNKIARRGDVTVSVHLEGEAQARAIDQAFAFKRDWLRDNGLLSQTVFEACSARFLASLPSAPGHPQMVVAEMSLDGKAIAIEIGFIFKHHYYSYMGAFDLAWRDYSPGKVQMREMISWCIANGIGQYDFLGTPAVYKSEWTDRTIGMRDFCDAGTLKGAAYARLWLGRLRPLAKRTFERLPLSRRRSVLRLVDYFSGLPGTPA